MVSFFISHNKQWSFRFPRPLLPLEQILHSFDRCNAFIHFLCPTIYNWSSIFLLTPLIFLQTSTKLFNFITHLSLRKIYIHINLSLLPFLNTWEIHMGVWEEMAREMCRCVIFDFILHVVDIDHMCVHTKINYKYKIV